MSPTTDRTGDNSNEIGTPIVSSGDPIETDQTSDKTDALLDCTPGSCQVKDGVAQCCVAISSLLNKETGTDPLANKCVDKANDGRDVDYPSLELRETNAIIECKAVFKLLGGMASTLAAISFVF